MAPTSGRAGRSTAFVAGTIAAIIGAAGCGGGSKPGSGTQFVDDKARVDVCVLTGATTNAGCDLGTGGGAEVKVGDLTMGQVKTRDVALYNGGAGNVSATIQSVTVDAGPNTATNYQIAKIFRLDTANNEIAVTLPFELAVSHGNELRVRVSYAAHDPIGAVAGASVKVVASHPSATTSIPVTGNITGCPAGRGDCDGNPANDCEVDLQADMAHCGACATSCGTGNAAGTTCAAGTCNIVCDAGFGNCDGDSANGCETNLLADPMHCNACGTACDASNGTASCTLGVCGISCNVGFGDCDNNPANGCETNLSTDAVHCGACATACDTTNSTPACVNSQCTVAACNSGFADCNSSAADGCEVNLQTDPVHCGACATACSTVNGTASCTSSACGITCNAGFENCDGNLANGCEVNTQTDPAHCGACATACNSTNGTATCAAGACGITCNAGFENCDGSLANGCEVNTQTDPAHCGACATACNSTNGTPTCAAGACGITCNTGFGNCDGSPANGCEVTLTSDLANCGTCGHVCGSANATPSCAAGNCGFVCSAGWADCNLLNADGCEVNLLLDAANCGACGAVCSLTGAVAACAGASCVVAACNPGRLDLNGLPGDGCEVDTTIDPNNCGGAGIVCTAANGTPACVNSQCVIAACNPGFADCNGLQADGCEIDLNADPSNCAACGNVCALPNTATAACTAGSCTVATCTAGFGNCNGAAADGCEVNTTNDTANCGACGTVCANGPNVTAEACVSSACQVTACAAGFYDANGAVADGCECQADTLSTTCAAPTVVGTLSPGQTVNVSGRLIPVGKQEYLQVTFTGNANASFHPRIRLTSNPTAVVRFDVLTTCAGGAPSCGAEGGVATARTDWETLYTGGDPSQPTEFIPIPPPGNAGTVLIRVFAAGTVPACISYTLTISD